MEVLSCTMIWKESTVSALESARLLEKYSMLFFKNLELLDAATFLCFKRLCRGLTMF
jgi:hypothetical protein